MRKSQTKYVIFRNERAKSILCKCQLIEATEASGNSTVAYCEHKTRNEILNTLRGHLEESLREEKEKVNGAGHKTKNTSPFPICFMPREYRVDDHMYDVI